MSAHPTPIQLKGLIQHYAWGQKGVKAFIPKWQGIPAKKNQPYAELWLGDHPSNPSQALLNNSVLPLNELIQSDPKFYLGKKNAQRFNPSLPFLIKIIDAATPLSVQTHPNPTQARKGYAREQNLNIPLGSAERIYKDPNGKTEQIIALTDFYALIGFRAFSKIRATLQKYSECAELLQWLNLEQNSLKKFYQRLMQLPQEQINLILTPLLARLAGHPLHKNQIEYWMLQADQNFSIGKNKDRGILCLLLMNLVLLKPGQSIILQPGDIHAYLEGAGLEVMTNSDNTLRCGLTPKTLNVPELLRTLNYKNAKPKILSPNKNGIYPTGKNLFNLSLLQFRGQRALNLSAKNVEILVVLKGRAIIQTEQAQLHVRQGDGVLIPSSLKKYAILKTEAPLIYRCAMNHE